MAKAKKTRSGKPDGRSKAARAAKAKAGAGGNGRDLHLADNGGNEEAIRAGFLSHRSRWISALARVKVAEKELKDAVADAKSDGYHKKMFVIADMLTASPKKEAKVVGEVKDRIQVARWIGHAMGKRIDPNQLDMFADVSEDDPEEAAYQDGRRVAMEGGNAAPPQRYGSGPVEQRWLVGYHEAQAKMVKDGIKPTEKTDDKPAAGWGSSTL